MSTNYTGEQIEVLRGLEAVRKRPGMYIGNTAERGLHQLVYEAVDNAVDEALAGYAKNIGVILYKDGSCSVEDDGRGIPVDLHAEEKMPAIDVVMTIVLDVYNPNSYDVAVRAVRGQTVMAGRYPINVDYHAPGEGLWLPAKQVTAVRVPVSVPVQLAFQLVQESLNAPVIPYRFQGKADVTATRTFQVEKDDYGVDEEGVVTREQMMAVLPNSFMPH